MTIFYHKKKKALIYIENEPNSEFWDKYWENKSYSVETITTLGSYESSLVSLSSRFLPSGALIVEAGCGSGRVLVAHHIAGYNITGIDYASRTISALRKACPDITVIESDIRSIPFPDSTFDGYWSIGVIEHFWEGYSNILNEALRVVKPGGFLFVSFPFMNYLRRYRGELSLYKSYCSSSKPENFFQFALAPSHFIRQCSDLGLEVCFTKYFASFERNLVDLGISDSVAKRLSQSRHPLARCLRLLARTLFSLFNINHSVLFVLKRK